MSWITHGLTLLNPEIFCAWTLLSLLLHTLALSGMEVEAGLADGLVKKNVTKVSSSNSGTRMVSDEQQEGEEEDAPYFLNTQRFISVFRGKMAILPCSVKHLGKRQVAWRRLETDEFLTIGKMVWSKDPRIVLEHKAHRADITSWDILLRNAKDEDAGYYECQVTSSEHLIWTLQLIVLEPVVTSKPKPRVHKQVTYSPLVTEKLHYNDERFLTQAEEFVTAGLPIRLACNTSLGNRTIPRSRLEWYKDGVNIQSNKHILLTRYQFETDRMYVSELLIDNARLSDSGLYLCRLKDHDLFVAKIYVLPDSKINGPKQERDDRSKIYGVDTLQQENHANRHVCSTTSLVVCFLFAILAAQQALLQGANHNERRGSIGRSWEGI